MPDSNFRTSISTGNTRHRTAETSCLSPVFQRRHFPLLYFPHSPNNLQTHRSSNPNTACYFQAGMLRHIAPPSPIFLTHLENPPREAHQNARNYAPFNNLKICVGKHKNRRMRQIGKVVPDSNFRTGYPLETRDTALRKLRVCRQFSSEDTSGNPLEPPPLFH